MPQFKLPREDKKPAPFDFPDGFTGGMNISVSADRIRLNQTPDAMNMHLDNGVWAKRFGFDRVNNASWGATPIQGMTAFYRIAQEPVFVIAHGGKLWSVDTTTGERTDLMTGTKASIEDVKTRFFTMNNWLFAMNGTDYVYWDGVGAVKNVADVAYVPTLTLGGSKDAPGTLNESLNYLSDSWIDSISPDGTAVTYPVSFTPTAELVTAEEDTASGVVSYTEGVNLTVNRSATPFATVTFTTPPAAGTDTLRIKSTKAGMMDKGRILECILFVVYGGKADTRVHFAGHPEYVNVRYSSGLEDPTYWPEDKWEPIGADNEAITGFGKVSDSLFTFKERSRYYTYIEGPDDAGNITFPTLPVNDEYGCIAPDTVWPAQNGLLALTKDGLTWSLPSSVRGQYNTKIVSYNINGNNAIGSGILDNALEDLKNAHAIIINNKYKLHIKDKVWVLDLNYSSLSSGDECWYPYDGVPGLASCFLEYDDHMHIGSNANGLIFRQVQEGDSHDKHYLDDGAEIDCYWTSPALYLGGREWVKRFERINITFQLGYCTEHTLTYLSDEGEEDINLKQESGWFNFNYATFACMTFGTMNTIFPKTQSEKIGSKGEYFQFRLSNNALNRRMVITSISIDYSLRKRVR